MKLLQGSWLLKIAALVLALMTYFYVKAEIVQQEQKDRISDPSYKLIKLTAKNLPVKVRIETEPPDGYHVVDSQVIVKPGRVIVVGPEVLLEDAEVAETAIIDVSENTKTVVKSIPLESVASIHLSGDPYTVEVTVPIEKIPEEPAAAQAQTAPAATPESVPTAGKSL